MAFDYVLKVLDTSGTVTLTAAPWAIRTPDLSAAGRDEVTTINTLTVRLEDGSAANNLAEVRALNGLLHRAWRRSHGERDLPPVYLVWKESSASGEWRSEIVDGRADWDDDALTRPFWEGATQFADVVVERRNYWDGPEAQLPLTNPNGTDNTAGLNVYNANTLSGASPNVIANYADIDGADIEGDLPAACRLEMTNTYATGRLYNVWIGANQTNPAAFTHYYAGPGAVTVANGATTVLEDWDLTGDQVSAAGGREYRAVLHFNSAVGIQTSQLARFKVELRWNATTLWSSGWVTPDTTNLLRVRDMFSFRLPPWIPGLTSLDGITLRLLALQTDLASMDIDITWLQLMCADAWRYISCVGYGIPQNGRIVDDGINDRLYADDGAGAYKIGILTGNGSSAVTLQPGRDHRLVFAQHSNLSDLAAAERVMSLKAFYRPRRLSL
jgi:hypothetical protein